MFKTCLGALGQKGRLVVIGMMSQYGAGWPQSALKGVPDMLLYKSASLNGFFLIHYAYLFKQHLSQLTNFMMQGQLKVGMDSAAFRLVCCHGTKGTSPHMLCTVLPVPCLVLLLFDDEVSWCVSRATRNVVLLQGCTISSRCRRSLAVRAQHRQGLCTDSNRAPSHDQFQDVNPLHSTSFLAKSKDFLHQSPG